MANPNKAARAQEATAVSTDTGTTTVTAQNSPGRKRAAARGKTIVGVVTGHTREKVVNPKLAQAPEPTPAQAALKANAAKRRAEEQEAAKQVKAGLAQRKAAHKDEPEARVLKVGSGSAIGVAAGAMDGQPHTKLAVEQARKAERATATAGGKVQAKDMAGNLVYVDPKSPLLYDGILFPNATHLSSYKASQKAAAKRPVKPVATKEKKERKPPPVRTAAAQPDRKYVKGEKANEAKAGSWTHYMVATAQAAKSTDAAKAKHAASGQYADKKLDWKWMADKGYIAWVA